MLSKLPKHESEIPRKGAVDFAANLRKLVEYQQQLVEQLNKNVIEYNKLVEEITELEVKTYDDEISLAVKKIDLLNKKIDDIKPYNDKWISLEVGKLIKIIDGNKINSNKLINESIKKLDEKINEIKPYNDKDIKARLDSLEGDIKSIKNMVGV
jgi:hypothetical protein